MAASPGAPGQPAYEQLASEKRRVPDHGIDFRPAGLASIECENRVPALDGFKRIENRIGRIAEPVASHPLDFADPYPMHTSAGSLPVGSAYRAELISVSDFPTVWWSLARAYDPVQTVANIG